MQCSDPALSHEHTVHGSSPQSTMGVSEEGVDRVLLLLLHHARADFVVQKLNYDSISAI